MSLFGSLMGDMEDDPIFGSHMRTMRQMNNMMNSLFADPFGMMAASPFNEFDNRALTHRSMHNTLMPFSMPMMPNYNRLMGGSLDSLGGGLAHGGHGNSHFSSSSTVVSMTSGPDGRPQVYKATSSTRVAPGGIKETQRTVTDSRSGTKKMAIGHHIGERAHIVEKEQNMHTGDREEREDFINLDEDEAEDFNKEWENKARSRSDVPRITAGSNPRNRHSYGGHYSVPAITAGSSRSRRERSSLVSPRRSIRSPKLALPSSGQSPSSHRYPRH
ncbi:unnamed protein product [Brassicogethes aeneus]|uniref:Myeloid leukemia factor n=1 Tax=Brassicogethes aeneus TaxID=1431903 RepID=A0A9P0BIN6_BRAAE|nr:unnamed protein product [Brassicogethes aeneus]